MEDQAAALVGQGPLEKSDGIRDDTQAGGPCAKAGAANRRAIGSANLIMRCLMLYQARLLLCSFVIQTDGKRRVMI
jgi:hypothetical protein